MQIMRSLGRTWPWLLRCIEPAGRRGFIRPRRKNPASSPISSAEGKSGPLRNCRFKFQIPENTPLCESCFPALTRRPGERKSSTYMLKEFIGTKAFYVSVILLIVPMIVQQGITQFVNLLDN